MARSSTRIAIESTLVLALAVGAWRVLKSPEPTPQAPASETPAPAKAREDRIGSVLAQRKAEKAAERAAEAEARRKAPSDPAQAFTVEPTTPPTAVMNLDKPEGVVTGELVDEQGRRLPLSALFFSEGGGFTFTVTEGRFNGRAKPGEWQAYAQYKEGLEIRRVGPFPVSIQNGATTTLSILVPLPAPPVGPGFSWVARGEFLEVQSVQEGSAAAQAGLAAGDAITEVAGRLVKDLEPAALESLLQGEAGSAFRIKVVANTGQGFSETQVDLVRPNAP